MPHGQERFAERSAARLNYCRVPHCYANEKISYRLISKSLEKPGCILFSMVGD